MADEKGAGPGGSAGGGDGSDARMGIIQINDLVYKLETDLSCAINRTHKTQFFQNQNYTDSQTSICIVNSGADYIDPRRSFLSFDIVPDPTVLSTANQFSSYFKNAMINCYFGKNGSVLNLIDSVVVSSRSGDELSRVNDYGQLMSMLLPEMFGQEWRDTIGQEIGLGSFLGGRNNTQLSTPPGGLQGEQRRRRFAVPLYLLSPIFNYGRLLPSMLMSGLRIEIKWKPLQIATQQFWEGLPSEWPADITEQPHTRPEDAKLPLQDDTETEYKTFLGGVGGLQGAGALDNAAFPPATTVWRYVRATAEVQSDILLIDAPAGGNPAILTPGYFQQGDTIAMSWDIVLTPDRTEIRFKILEVLAGGVGFAVATDYQGPTWALSIRPESKEAGGVGEYLGAWRLSAKRPLNYQRDFAAGAFHNKFLTPDTPLANYVINQPEIALCSIQLTDAIQRTLNEFSSINGLEIVYADYDRTSTPLQGNSVPIYTEVRKSASRALAAFGRVVNASPSPYRYDSFASAFNVYWNNYQWQLGSLYFPQQRVESRETVPELKRDGVLVSMYSYTQDAFDRYHPKAAPTMATMRGTGIEYNVWQRHPTETHAGHEPSQYLAPYSAFGKWGSFVNGATTVATTLERSTLFDLSGIPINNSRVLALRGEVDMSAYALDLNFRAQLFIFLKYVRLARVFLVNCEVEQ